MSADDAFNKYQRAVDVFQDDEEDILLRLEFLKEHAGYRSFFTAELRMAVEAHYLWLEGQPDYFPEDECLEDNPAQDEETTHFSEDSAILNLHRGLRQFNVWLTINLVMSAHPKEWLDVLDPRVEMKDIPPRIRKVIFPHLFYTPGVQEVIQKDRWPLDYDGFPIVSHWQTISFDCAIYQCLLKIDLRKKPAKLLNEFKAFLRIVEANRAKDLEGSKGWKQDRTRKREEAWMHLKAWRLRRQIPMPSFSDIAQKLLITPAAAKKSVYRAYELIYGKPFDLKAWENDRATKSSKTCGNCPSYEGCTDPCPEIFDERNSTREYLTKNFEEISDSHSYNEWLNKKEENEQ